MSITAQCAVRHWAVILILSIFIFVTLFCHSHHNTRSRMTLDFDCIPENNMFVTNHVRQRSGVSLAPSHRERSTR
ncbi:uncharacterized protein HD556DRAFT_1356831 [Suillus plorans]|uniref:Uncharacterized protein n=1 Tax=Suillus plorans TaxID=116603 RepID=A0A9P7DL10_9AGAM|nr:uncharacterized protein HD556DRAFT_1356831 [Suillus plorans]KAG1797440.1 hypothetical protein HD556DRAFT_1356831 [Suillus plorans]